MAGALKWAWYNEIDAAKAEWLRENIKAGLCAPGEVDERSVADVRPDDLRGFRQCHFFAGIGIWSYALRLAGWPDDRPVWTGSCPCQPFSVSGKRAGGADDRHLWPHWARLIRECGPAEVLGEQVEAAVRHGWFDLVSDDLEAAGYAVGAIAFPACSVGAPHIRQRLYFGAYAASARGQQQLRSGAGEICAAGCEIDHWWPAPQADIFAGGGATERSADTLRDGTGHATGESLGAEAAANGEDGRLSRKRLRIGVEGAIGLMPNSPSERRREARQSSGGRTQRDGEPGELGDTAGRGCGVRGSASGIARWAAQSGATRGFWSGCDWWYGRDGKYRPIKPGLFPLAHGVAARVLKLRGAGDGIVSTQAKAFIEAWQESVKEIA